MMRFPLPAASFGLFAALASCLSLLSGCSAKPSSEAFYGNTRAIMAGTDDFGMLLLSAGVAPEALPTSKALTVAEAERLRLMLTLLLADGSMQRYGARLAADFLASEVIAGGKAVSRATLGERLRRFERLAVLRPDGYLASVSTGSPIQCVGPIQVQNGALRSGAFTVGAFYAPEGSGFREVTELYAGRARAHVGGSSR